MVEKPLTLVPTDPAIFAKCETCAEVRKGLSQPQYFGKAFSPIAWKQNPKCDNCGGDLTVLFRVKPPKRRRP